MTRHACVSWVRRKRTREHPRSRENQCPQPGTRSPADSSCSRASRVTRPRGPDRSRTGSPTAATTSTCSMSRLAATRSPRRCAAPAAAARLMLNGHITIDPLEAGWDCPAERVRTGAGASRRPAAPLHEARQCRDLRPRQIDSRFRPHIVAEGANVASGSAPRFGSRFLLAGDPRCPAGRQPARVEASVSARAVLVARGTGRSRHRRSLCPERPSDHLRPEDPIWLRLTAVVVSAGHAPCFACGRGGAVAGTISRDEQAVHPWR